MACQARATSLECKGCHYDLRLARRCHPQSAHHATVPCSNNTLPNLTYSSIHGFVSTVVMWSTPSVTVEQHKRMGSVCDMIHPYISSAALRYLLAEQMNTITHPKCHIYSRIHGDGIRQPDSACHIWKSIRTRLFSHH